MYYPTARLLSIFAMALATAANVACGGAADSPAPSPAPPSPSGTATRLSKTLVVDGRERRYTVNLPPGHDSNGSATVPLIVAMHGGGGSSAQFEATSLLTPKADAANMAVVYPNGTDLNGLGLQTWNGGGCCGAAVSQNVDDVKFLLAMIDDLVAQHRIDPQRVYATGHSNGGFMSYRLACDRADRVAALAPNASVEMAPTCAPSRPVPLLHMHSKLDNNVPVAGGVGVGLSGVNYAALRPKVDAWAARNGCSTGGAQPQVTTQPGAYTRTFWSACAAGSEVDLIITDDGGHAWPGGLPGSASGDTPSTAINANDRLIAFFSRFKLP